MSIRDILLWMLAELLVGMLAGSFLAKHNQTALIFLALGLLGIFLFWIISTGSGFTIKL